MPVGGGTWFSRPRVMPYHSCVGQSDLRRCCGQLLSVGFEGTSAPAELLARIGRSEVGSVILFRPNVGSPAEVAALVGALRGAAPPEAPLPVAVDQEGGLVQRLRAPLTEWPDMLSVAAAGDPARSFAVGRALGEELALLGIGWTLAPVLDIHTNPANPVIGNRAFGTTPAAVITHALSFWRGLRAAGVQGCGKHFPGHGDTALDSHHNLPAVEHPLQRLRTVELAPFAAAVQAGAEALMSAHVLYPALDGAHPATLSAAIATDLLRGELGFGGLLVSDDLGMKAVAEHFSIEEIVGSGLAAGIDHFIIRGPTERQVAAWEALVRAGEAEPALRDRIEQSAARVMAFKAGHRVGLPAGPEELRSAFPSAAHQSLAASFPRLGVQHGNSPVVGY
jgi:beta-N-acetylhexosaminidase